jgi:prepilin-type N-terminal cleavage/methylation domain-containing protein
MKQNIRGFTLLELMVTLGIFAILASFVGPSFVNLITSNKLVGDRDKLTSSLQLAKTESINRGAAVAICPSTDGLVCSNGDDWSVGWMIYTDANATGLVSVVDTVIRVEDELTNVNVVHNGHRAGLTPSLFIRYLPQGYASDSGPIPGQTIGFCDPNNRVPARAIILSQTTGQARSGDANEVVCP